MVPPTNLLPRFTFTQRVDFNTGRQDKIQIAIEGWQVVGSTEAAILDFYTSLGSPPPVAYRGRGVRQDLGIMYGWLFNSPSAAPWGNGKKTLTVRSGTLQIEGEPPTFIHRPLFSGRCEWTPVSGPRFPTVKARLALDINPTRFLRHHPFDAEGGAGMQERELPLTIHGEASFDREDNFLPLSGRLWSQVKPGRWLRQVLRYIQKIEQVFADELVRGLELEGTSLNPLERPHYSVGYVETYWEWLSDDPLRLVHDLAPLVRSFARRPSRQRNYEYEQHELDQDMAIVSFEYSPGELVKIYAKTNYRIRIEVCHRFNGRTGRFQFPAVTGEGRSAARSREHTFDSLVGVMTLFERLRERSSTIVNELLAHFEAHGSIPESHFSAYHLIAVITHHLAIPSRARAGEIVPTNAARTILSMLVNNGSLAAGGEQPAVREGIRRLAQFSVLQRNSRGRYVVTEPFRHALATLRANTWSLITAPSLPPPPRRRRRSDTGDAPSPT